MTNGDASPPGLGRTIRRVEGAFGRRAGRVSLLAMALGLVVGWHSGVESRSPPAPGLPPGGHMALRSDRPSSLPLPAPSGEAQEVTVWLRFPDRVDRTGALPVRVALGDRTVVAKKLHNADPDLFVVLKPSPGSPYQLSVGQEGVPVPEFQIEVVPLRSTPDGAVVVEAEPNDRPEDATLFHLGSAVFASADDRPFIRAPDQPRSETE